jgi:NAD(P)-dependent dehydrogenase (short-subunit alcohol dehydrogenase family)
MGRFDDQVAIVTGAGSGTGAAIATRLAEEGASVVCTDLDGAEQTAALLGERGRAVRLDVADAGSVGRLMAEVRETYGRLDALFNNAGPAGAVRPLTELSEENFELVIRVNLKGPFLTMKHAIPLMVEGGGGAVVTSPPRSRSLARPASPTTRRPRLGCSSSPRPRRWSSASMGCV